jgi:hypothetical protein
MVPLQAHLIFPHWMDTQYGTLVWITYLETQRQPYFGTGLCRGQEIC